MLPSASTDVSSDGVLGSMFGHVGTHCCMDFTSRFQDYHIAFFVELSGPNKAEENVISIMFLQI